jgi:hypothetical protein
MLDGKSGTCSVGIVGHFGVVGIVAVGVVGKRLVDLDINCKFRR